MLAILGFIGELLSSNGVKLVICNVFSGTCVLWNEASGLLTAVKMNARDQSYCSVVVFKSKIVLAAVKHQEEVVRLHGDSVRCESNIINY